MKRSVDPLTKHTLHLSEGDYKALQERFPQVGAAFVIRTLVSKFRRDLENKELPVKVEPAIDALEGLT